MEYGKLSLKTNKESREFDSVNATLLSKGGFVDQVMAGVYAFLPLGVRVLTNIENIVREEMNTVGVEILLPALSPKSLWEKSGRLETIDVLFEARGANDLARAKNSASYILNPTHEEIVTELLKHVLVSYKDLPAAVYQIQTKFRSEPRAKSGLLRGREFRMKDLYSFHESEDDLNDFYEKMKDVYMRVFTRLGIGEDTHVALAGGGDFTKNFSHEFQTECETGEDIIFYDAKEDTWYNKEIASEELQASATPVKASEVGNIYRFGTKYSDSLDHSITKADGTRQSVHTGSYGIGTTRIMGLLAEKLHDDKGIIWPKEVAPFSVYLVEIRTDARAIYEKLTKAGIEVLYDNRDVSPGAKFADADLLGIPWRAVFSPKTDGALEIKERTSESTQIMDVDSFIQELLSK